MRLRGKLTKWKDDRGFGFITPIRGGRQVFVHIKAFTNQHRRPIGNEFVTYETASDETGRLRAEHVEFIGDDSINAAVSLARRRGPFRQSHLAHLKFSAV